MKSLTIYIASSFDEAATCEKVRKLMIHHGHTVPDVWWNVNAKDDFVQGSDLEFYGSPLIQAIAARHWTTIQECDIVVLVSSQSAPRSFTGANVEIGYALALGKPVLAIGQLKRSAMYVPIIKARDILDLADVVNCIAQERR